MNPIRPLLATLGVAALLAVPTAAGAKRPDHAGNHQKAAHATKTVGYVFKGTWAGGSVAVTKGNKHVRRAELVGQTVEFDLTDARLVLKDDNGDGVKDLSDVEDGDNVLVKARLPKSDPGDDPYAAKKLVDKTHPQSGDDEEQSGEDEQSGGDDTETETETPAP